jgi:hypothetical protein
MRRETSKQKLEETIMEMKELKEAKEIVVDTNEHDVEIARVKAEVDKLKIQMGSHFQQSEMVKKEETERFKQVVGSVESVLFGGMILTGYMYAKKKQYDILRYNTEYGER